MRQSKIESAAGKAGWSCRIEKTDDGYEVLFRTDSPCGQDVNCEIVVKKLNDVPNEVHDYWQSYDPDEEALLWYGANRGEPKSLRELLNDMDWVDNMLEDLSTELCNI